MDLKETLLEVERSGKGTKLALNMIKKSRWATTKTRLSEAATASKSITGMSYHVSLIWLNQGLDRDGDGRSMIKVMSLLNEELKTPTNIETVHRDFQQATAAFGLSEILPRANQSKTRNKVDPELDVKACLCCLESFNSTGKFNRICTPCKKSGDKIGTYTPSDRKPTIREAIPRRLSKAELKYENMSAKDLVKEFKRTWKKPSIPKPMMSTTTYR